MTGRWSRFLRLFDNPAEFCGIDPPETTNLLRQSFWNNRHWPPGEGIAIDRGSRRGENNCHTHRRATPAKSALMPHQVAGPNLEQSNRERLERRAHRRRLRQEKGVARPAPSGVQCSYFTSMGRRQLCFERSFQRTNFRHGTKPPIPTRAASARETDPALQRRAKQTALLFLSQPSKNLHPYYSLAIFFSLNNSNSSIFENFRAPENGPRAVSQQNELLSLGWCVALFIASDTSTR